MNRDELEGRACVGVVLKFLRCTSERLAKWLDPVNGYSAKERKN